MKPLTIVQVGVCEGNDEITDIVKKSEIELLVLVEPLPKETLLIQSFTRWRLLLNRRSINTIFLYILTVPAVPPYPSSTSRTISHTARKK